MSSSEAVHIVEQFLGKTANVFTFEPTRLDTCFHETAVWQLPPDALYHCRGSRTGLDAIADHIIFLFSEVFLPLHTCWNIKCLTGTGSCATAEIHIQGRTVTGGRYDAIHVMLFETERGKIFRITETIRLDEAA